MELCTEINQCRICGHRHLEEVLDLGMMALTGIFPHSKAESVPRAPLKLVKCHPNGREDSEHCGLLQLSHSCHAERMYGDTYGYRSGLNKSMVDHLEAKVRRILAQIQLKPGDLVLDIGSNDGTLLKAYPDKGLHLVGIDPTGVKFREFYPNHIELIPDFFSAKKVSQHCGGRKARVITSVAMFYDLEDPLEFMRQISELLTRDGLWIFELSYMPSMLGKNSYDTICHEHLEFYSLKQIKWMVDRSNLKIVDVDFNEANGGSFSITTARSDSDYSEREGIVDGILDDEERAGFDSLETYGEFGERIRRRALELRNLIETLNRERKTVFGLGASTKGNVILQYCGLTEKEIPFVAEINESKFGAWTPGSGIPIISEYEARSMKPDYFLVLPWHFRSNLIEREREFLRGGGKFIFPLPEIEVIGGRGAAEVSSHG